jgi:hypothetical protein
VGHAPPEAFELSVGFEGGLDITPLFGDFEGQILCRRAVF